MQAIALCMKCQPSSNRRASNSTSQLRTHTSNQALTWKCARVPNDYGPYLEPWKVASSGQARSDSNDVPRFLDGLFYAWKPSPKIVDTRDSPPPGLDRCYTPYAGLCHIPFVRIPKQGPIAEGPSHGLSKIEMVLSPAGGAQQFIDEAERSLNDSLMKLSSMFRFCSWPVFFLLLAL